VGALIMLGTLGGLVTLVYGLVLRYDPEARRRPAGESDDESAAEGEDDAWTPG
jgi:hypothetical protein